MASIEVRPGVTLESTRMSAETALHRTKPSTFARLLVKKGLVQGNIFDWGCGHGRDLAYFRELGFKAEGWDPIHRPNTPPSSFPQGSFDLVHSAFVLNTIAFPEDRLSLLSEIYDFLPEGGRLAVAVRAKHNLKWQIKPGWLPFKDGWITLKNTFQRGYTKEELAELLKSHFQEVKILPAREVGALATKAF